MARKKQIVALLLLVLVAGATFWATLQNPAHSLEKLGYAQDEASEIVKLLSPADIDYILVRGHDPNILAMLHAPEFRAENFQKYLLAQVSKQFTPEEIVLLVNHPDYETSLTYDHKMFEIMLDPYYIPAKRAAYFAALASRRDEIADNVLVPFEGEASEIDAEITTRDLVERVNAGHTRPVYEQAEPTDPEWGELMLVNKFYYLDADFAPPLVEMDAQYGAPSVLINEVAYQHFQDMYTAAAAAGLRLYVTSGYRDYWGQQEVLNDYLSRMNEVEALKYAAKPGHSEHQTGLALDIFTPGGTIDNFASLPEAQWLADHAYEYGFILRYPKGKEEITGFDYEAWHYRYVGKEVAEYLQHHGITFDEWAEWMAAEENQ